MQLENVRKGVHNALSLPGALSVVMCADKMILSIPKPLETN